MIKWIKSFFEPIKSYNIIKIYDDCEIRSNYYRIWVHITNEEKYFTRLQKRHNAFMKEVMKDILK